MTLRPLDNSAKGRRGTLSGGHVLAGGRVLISERSDSGATPPTSPSRPKPPSEAKCRVEVALSELPTPHAQLLLEALEMVLLSAQRRATQRLLLVR